MAMSDTAGSSFAHWAGLYQHEPSPVLTVAADASALATGGGGGAGSPTSGGSGGSPTKSPQRQHVGVEGPLAAVGKPAARRRSRASRRAPVTLLNTDAANFRAMVQQFTGIPAPPAGAFPGAAGGAPLISFAGGNYGFPAPAGVMSYHHLHRSHAPAPPPLQDQQLFRPQPQQQYTGAAMFGSYSNTLHGAGAGDMFASAEDRMLLQSMQAAQMPHMPPASAAHNGGANGYFA